MIVRCWLFRRHIVPPVAILLGCGLLVTGDCRDLFLFTEGGRLGDLRLDMPRLDWLRLDWPRLDWLWLNRYGMNDGRCRLLIAVLVKDGTFSANDRGRFGFDRHGCGLLILIFGDLLRRLLGGYFFAGVLGGRLPDRSVLDRWGVNGSCVVGYRLQRFGMFTLDVEDRDFELLELPPQHVFWRTWLHVLELPLYGATSFVIHLRAHLRRVVRQTVNSTADHRYKISHQHFLM